jgi:tetratricopeptide (TPR) repeat protein
MRLGEYENAVSSLLEATNVNPDRADFWVDLGNSYEKLNLDNEAIGAFRRAVSIDPNDWLTFAELSFIYIKNEEMLEAIEAVEKAIELNPKHLRLKNILGSLYRITNQNEKSILFLKESLVVDPENSLFWYNIGISYFWNNDLINAKVSFINALSYSKESIVEDEHRYSCLIKLLEVQFALKETSEALSSIETLFSKAERLEFIGKLEDALVLLCKENSEDAVKEVFNKLLQICIANHAIEKLSALLSNVVFRILREHKDLKPFRIELLQHVLDELFSSLPEFTYPLRYLNIGIRYFLKDEKEAIYEMSQEERTVFEKFTSTNFSE